MPNPIDMFMSKRSVGDAMYDYMINNGNVEKRARVFYGRIESLKFIFLVEMAQEQDGTTPT